MKIQRALISVSDKTGLVEFARELAALGIEIISTGGTAKLLQKENIQTTEISAYTGFPEMMDGRVKTLHPKVHGGLLHLRDNPEHVAQAAEHGIQPIDLVVVNLYPFEKTIAKPDVTLDEAIEQIDIGGPSMLRSAAKNYRSVTVVTDPADYADVAEILKANDGETTLQLRERLAIKVFVTTSNTTAPLPTSSTRKRNARAVLASAFRSSRSFATAKIRTRLRRSTATSTSTLKSSTARNFPTTTSSISPPRRN